MIYISIQWPRECLNWYTMFSAGQSRKRLRYNELQISFVEIQWSRLGISDKGQWFCQNPPSSHQLCQLEFHVSSYATNCHFRDVSENNAMKMSHQSPLGGSKHGWQSPLDYLRSQRIHTDQCITCVNKDNVWIICNPIKWIGDYFHSAEELMKVTFSYIDIA